MNTDQFDVHSIYLAGGCFWGVEAYIKKLPGICDSAVGYANGNTHAPSYEDVCYRNTGHAETVKVSYNKNEISLEFLLKAFFEIIDPTSKNRQGNDRGSQYRTGIYYTDENDLAVIQKVIQNEQDKYDKEIVTEVEPLKNFYLAEEYHQDYLDKNPNGYCHINLNRAEDFIALSKANNEMQNLNAVIESKHYHVPKMEELKNKLSDLEWKVTRENATEQPFVNPYDNHFEKGIYVDITSGEPLFSSLDKFASGCGWPSFSKPITKEVVHEKKDLSHFMVRTEVRGRAGDSHLGHVFGDGPKESGGLRYCINSAALKFVPYDDMEKEGYGYLKVLFDKFVSI